jgi:hypothetical protein
MQAVILHAGGDETLAAEVAAKVAPAASFSAHLRPDAGVTYGDQLALFAIWSAAAEAEGLGQALSRVAARAAGRCVVVRADGTPLPPLPTDTQLLTIGAGAGSFAHALGLARARAPLAAAQSRPAQTRARAVIGGWTPGVSIGLAIYAGMFVVAGAWRSEEVNEAIVNGQAVPLAVGLHSFQTATAASVDRIQLALAPTAPTATFEAPQRVVLTGTLDTSSIPIVAEAPMVLAEDARAPAPIRLQPIDASLVVPLAPIGAPLDASLPTYAALDLIETPSFDIGSSEF